jgi:hypothetical protein
MYHRRLGQDNSLVLSMCFDARDLSSEAQDVVIERAAELFADLDVVVEVCNEARVHLWYEEHFGVPAEAFDSSRDAIDRCSTPCCRGRSSPLFRRQRGANASTGPRRRLRARSAPRSRAGR